MPPARPRANSLSIPIPTIGLWHLRRSPIPRRATYPLPIDHDTPPVPSLSFWDSETPSPFPTSVPSMASTTTPLMIQTSSSSQQNSTISPKSTPSSCYSQTREVTMAPEQAVIAISPEATSPAKPCLLPPLPSPYSVISPYSPISPTSPHSPYNPFLCPPPPRLTTPFFRLASPLLPASPLSIFDRAISPTSPTLLLRRTPSPVTPTWQPTFRRSATPSMAACSTWDGLSPTFLSPRTPPAISRANTRVEAVQTLERRRSSASLSTASPPPTVEAEEVDTTEAETQRKEMKIEFYHFLAAKRAAAMNRLSTSPSVKSEKSRRAKVWKKLLPRGKVAEIDDEPSRRRRFRVWSGIGSRG